jgi:hypothetical protein
VKNLRPPARRSDDPKDRVEVDDPLEVA